MTRERTTSARTRPRVRAVVRSARARRHGALRRRLGPRGRRRRARRLGREAPAPAL